MVTGVAFSPFTLLSDDKIRRTAVYDQFGGGRQGGISPSAKNPNISLITDPKTGLQHGYSDGWNGDGCFHYTGESQHGDQELKAGNAAILEY
jgi:hypothetical protein